MRSAIGLAQAWAAHGAAGNGAAALREIVGAFGDRDGPDQLDVARQMLAGLD